jgi:hypothetical protein
MGLFNSSRCGICPQLAPKIEPLRVWSSERRVPAALARAPFDALLAVGDRHGLVVAGGRVLHIDQQGVRILAEVDPRAFGAIILE